MSALLIRAAAGLIATQSIDAGRSQAAAEALHAAGLLQSPETAAAQDQLRARVDEVERAYTYDTAALRSRVAELEELADRQAREIATLRGAQLLTAAGVNEAAGRTPEEHAAHINALRDQLGAAALVVITAVGDKYQVVNSIEGISPLHLIGALHHAVQQILLHVSDQDDTEPVTVYRAELNVGEEIRLGLFTNRAAARACCEEHAREVEGYIGDLVWEEYPTDDPAEPGEELRAHDGATGYNVVPVTAEATFQAGAEDGEGQ